MSFIINYIELNHFAYICVQEKGDRPLDILPFFTRNNPCVMSKQSIGDKIRKFRTEVLSLSQRELGLELDSTQAGISQIESGEVLPSASFMKKLAERFPDVNYNWLF